VIDDVANKVKEEERGLKKVRTRKTCNMVEAERVSRERTSGGEGIFVGSGKKKIQKTRRVFDAPSQNAHIYLFSSLFPVFILVSLLYLFPAPP